MVDLWHRLYALKCLNDLNVKTHIQLLNAMYQQLKEMGKETSNSDFMTLILASLLKSYWLLINTISLQNRAATKALKPNVIMESILKKFDQLQIEDSQLKGAENAMMVKGSKGKGKKNKHLTAQCIYAYKPSNQVWYIFYFDSFLQTHWKRSKTTKKLFSNFSCIFTDICWCPFLFLSAISCMKVCTFDSALSFDSTLR